MSITLTVRLPLDWYISSPQQAHVATILDVATLISDMELWLCDRLCLRLPRLYTSELGIRPSNATMRCA